jgi:redox-sensitive bicupin YhaK (pirin superfamily)
MNASAVPLLETLPAHIATVGSGMQVRRALPTKLRRMVGAWCFLDHYGPVPVPPEDPGMRIGPHPHMGLQTVSWLYSGEVFHRDSLGSKQLIRPGQLNLMTAGHGISHSEESPKPHPAGLHGLQFWIALPELARHNDPAFDHHPKLPALARDGLQMSLIVGEALGERSPAKVHTPLMGLDVRLADVGRRRLSLDPHFEHALLPIEGSVTVEGRQAEPGALCYLGAGRDGLLLENDKPAHVFIIGGEPLKEEVLLWWNFVARNEEEMREASREWQARDARFGEVHGYDGPRLVAPEIVTRLKPS